MISRLSPYNIKDTLRRGELYRDIRDGAKAKISGWMEYEIQQDERLSPELISYRVYGTDELKWLIVVIAELDDIREALPVGETIRLPGVVWVRQRIRHHVKLEEAA